MRIPAFRIQNQRNIRLAACDHLPDLMIITGPNGCGKSTLLQALRNAGGSPGPILYVAPHRASTRQQVPLRTLLREQIGMRQLLTRPHLPNVEGISIHRRTRDAWDIDEAANFLKYGLCQIEFDRQSAIAQRWDHDHELPKDSIPDVWEPFRKMTQSLLPHLRFLRIDTSNRQQVQCLWHVHSREITVDIDDLSSGEKAIIQLFFPLIENRIRAHLESLKGEKTEKSDENVCVLIDEPELHIHPILQGKILDYIRSLATEESLQFIVATHSTTIVEEATSEELYLLRPSEMLEDPNENQLIRIASDDEKLRMMREVFGSTANITALRPILVVEGTSSDRKSRRAPDSRIYSFLSERFNQLTLLPGGGKGESKKLAEALRNALREVAPSLTVYPLLDRDTETGGQDEVLLLPVSMVENLLLDPEVLWDALHPVHEECKFSSSAEVDEALTAILDEMESLEVDRRVKVTVGAHTFRVRDPVAEAEKQLGEFVSTLGAILSPENLKAFREAAERTVEALRTENRRREHFHGKDALDLFFQRHVHHTTLSKPIFYKLCARAASRRKLVKRFIDELFHRIKVPDKVEPAPKPVQSAKASVDPGPDQE